MPVISTIAAATARAFGAFKAAAGGAADEFFNYVTLLLHGDGTNGAQNNTFLDSSTNNFTITRNGNTTQGTFSPFSQDDGKWGAYFDGSGDYLQATDASAFDLSNFDWCFECWAYIQGTGTQTLLSLTDTGASAGSNAVLSIQYVGSTSKITWSTGSSSGISNQTITSTNTFSTNQFLHVAAVRDGATITLYVNGANEGTYNVSTGTFNAGRDFLYIGNRRGNSGLTDYLTGYLSNVRVVINAPVYTAPFTPSTTPLTAITNTSLLTCQSNRFKDNSANAFAITVNGNTSIQPFSPFAPSAAYSAATNGGSGYFDGSGDYLTAGSASDWAFLNNGSSFTIECFVYVSSATTTQRIVSTTTQSAAVGFSFHINSNSTITLRINNGTATTTFTSTGTISANSWNHVAVTFNTTGKTATFYINGSSAGSSSDAGFSYLASNPTNTINIGRAPEDVSYITGYISTLRITNTVVYNSSFTTPATPLTAISGTSLLLNFTNTGILDNTSRNDLETVGNAQISTSVKKFGTGSFYTGATSGSHYLRLPAHPFYQFGTENFTIEGWFQPLSAGNERTFYMHGVNTTGGMALFCGTGGVRFRANGSSDLSYSTTLSSSAFTHIAFVRDGTTRRIFINGTQVASDTLSFNVSDNVITDIGATAQNASDSFKYYGYIDDLRITKGVARYTSNFTPPTAAFEDQ